MNKELYHLLEDYKGSELDDDFIRKSYDIMIADEDDLRDKFVEGLDFDEKLKSIGMYDVEDKRIIVSGNNIKRSAIRENYYNEKLYALHILRHEFEHARAIKRSYEVRKDIESTVNNYSLRLFYIKFGGFNTMIPEIEPYSLLIDEENYIYNPGERIADIKSWKFIVNLLKNQKRTQDLLYARSMLFFSYIRGYEDNRYYLDPPTYTYLLNQRMFNNYRYLKRRVDSKEYSLDTRLLCGLPITYKEYDKTILNNLGLQRVKK